MAVTGLRGRQILDDSVVRGDLNTTSTGDAVIRKIIAGTGLSISSTGVDAGTGDVTVSQVARTINGVTYDGSANITITANTTNALTFNNGGAGIAPNNTFNGSAAVTVSYNTIGAPGANGQNASGSWAISVTGNAATATVLQTARAINGVSFDGSAAITITANTTNALTFNNSGAGVVSGSTFNGSTGVVISYNTIGAMQNPMSALGDIIYGGASGAATRLAAGTAGQALVSAGAAAPVWTTLTLENLPDAWVKRAVKAATTANITLSGTQTIDGIALVAGDRVLVKDQTTASQNGIYIVAAGAWSRAADADNASELTGAMVAVDQGTVNGGLTYDNDFKSTDTLGTTAMNWNRVVDSGYTIPATQGGTGQTVYAVGDLLYASATNALARLAGVATGNVLISGGVATAPSWGKVDLTTHISGTLAVGNGGTGATTLTGVMVGNGTAAVSAVAGTASQLLRRNAGNTAYEFFTHDFASTAGASFTGQIISTRANNAADGAGQIYLNGLNGNRIDFNQNGVAAPTFTTRSAGAKIVLYPNITASTADYAIGISSNTLWFGVPDTAQNFRWFGGTTNTATLTGAGALTLSSTVTATQFIRSGGTSAQFLKADGSIDSSTYMTNPMTTIGDIIYGGAAGAATRLAAGTAGQALVSAGAAAPAWTTLTLENLPDAWVKRAVKVATTANITLSGTQTIDGIAVVAGDRVLVKDQTTASANGIYIVAAGAWTRATDADTSSEIAGGTVAVDQGTTNGGTSWDTDFKSTDTLGTTNMTWFRLVDTGYTIPVTQGGTGATTLTGVLIGNGTGAVTAVSGTASQLLRRNAGNTAYEFFTFTGVTGSGTINTIPKWSGSTTALANSSITDDGSSVVVNLGTFQATATQAGAGLTSLIVSNTDSTAAVTHTGRFATQQLGSGLARTLIYAASNTTGVTRGQLAVLTENGGSVIMQLGTSVTSSDYALSVHNIAGTEIIRLNSSGTSFINGGNVTFGTNGFFYDDLNKRLGIGVTGNPTVPLDFASNSAIAKFQSTTATATAYLRFQNNTSGSGNFYLGLEDSASSTFGATAYAGTIFTSSGVPIEIFPGSTKRAEFKTTGQFRLNAYTATTSFSGTVAGYLAFDSSGNILTASAPGGSTQWTTSGSSIYYSGGTVIVGGSSATSRFNVQGGSLATNGSGIQMSADLTTGRFGAYDAGSLMAIHSWLDATGYEISAGSTSGWVSGISIIGNNAVNNPGTVRIFTASVERARWNVNGDMGLGTTSITNTANYTSLQVNGTTGGIVRFSYGGTNAGHMYGSSAETAINGPTQINLYVANSQKFMTNSTEVNAYETFYARKLGAQIQLAGGVATASGIFQPGSNLMTIGDWATGTNGITLDVSNGILYTRSSQANGAYIIFQRSGSTDYGYIGNSAQLFGAGFNGNTELGIRSAGAINFATSGGVAIARIQTTGQLRLPLYTAASTFTGTAVGILAFDSSGNILTTAVPTSGIAFTEVTGTTQAAAINTGYIANNASLVTITLPGTAAIGSVVEIVGKGAGLWRLAQPAGLTIRFGNLSTTAGTGGWLQATQRYDSIRLICTTANTEWTVVSVQGVIDVN